MRILHFSSLWPPIVLGGAEMYASRLAAEQRHAGHTVGVLTLGVTGDDVVEAVPPWPYRLDQFPGQPRWKKLVFRLEDVYNPVAAARMRTAVKRFRPDVIHSHSIVGLSTAALTAAASRVPHVHHLHDYWLMCRRTTMRLPSGEVCEDLGCRAITTARSLVIRRHPPELLLAPSECAQRDHARMPWTAGRFRHLPYTIGEEFEGTRPVPPAGSRPVTFGYIGQVSEQKGVGTMLEAFAGMGSAGHRLLVAGEGALLERVRRAGDGVVALGFVGGADKVAFFDEIDCLIVPSMWPETGPMVVLEARAKGLPVIGAAVGGIPENVGDRNRPLLFTPGDPTELRAALDRFAAEPDSFAPPAGGPPARIGLSWSDHTELVVGLYDEAARRHSRSA